MKKIFLLAGIASFTVAAAQNDRLPKVQVVPPKSKNNIATTPNIYYVTPGQQQLIADAKLLNTLPNGNKVYDLPQDNMSCVVPDISQFNMPVATPPNEAYTIPNPAYPSNTKPSIFTEEQLKQFLEKQRSDKQKKPR